MLLTGFEGFAEYPVNSSWEGVRWLDGRVIRGIPIIARELPVEFRKIRPALFKILEDVRPCAVIAFGLTPGRVVSIERVALNVAHVNRSSRHFKTTGDNTGYRPYEVPLSKGGPDVYWSTLPTDAIERAVRRVLGSMRTHIVSWVSHSAGTFLCNAAFYHLAKWAVPPRRAGFIHLAPLRNGEETTADARLKRFTVLQLKKLVSSVVRAMLRDMI